MLSQARKNPSSLRRGSCVLQLITRQNENKHLRKWFECFYTIILVLKMFCRQMTSQQLCIAPMTRWVWVETCWGIDFRSESTSRSRSRQSLKRWSPLNSPSIHTFHSNVSTSSLLNIWLIHKPSVWNWGRSITFGAETVYSCVLCSCVC